MMPIDAERAELVRSRADDWAHKLVDPSSRNTALFFKSTKAASLDLGGAEPVALAELLGGKTVRLSTLFPDPETQRAAAQSTRSISGRIAAFEEEQGVDVGKVAHGFVTMPRTVTRGTRSLPPLRAPLLLRTLHISARTLGERDYVLSLESDTEINPVLLHALDKLDGLDIDPTVDFSSIVEAVPQDAHDRNQPTIRVHQLLSGIALRQAFELKLEPSVVVGLFHYDKLRWSTIYSRRPSCWLRTMSLRHSLGTSQQPTLWPPTRPG